jgi:hypothetical protein
MGNARSEMLKLLIVAGLLAAAGLVIIQSGVGLPAILLSGSGLAALFWWFIRRPRPEGELPCTSVSCCHYLEDSNLQVRPCKVQSEPE